MMPAAGTMPNDAPVNAWIRLAVFIFSVALSRATFFSTRMFGAAAALGASNSNRAISSRYFLAPTGSLSSSTNSVRRPGRSTTASAMRIAKMTTAYSSA